MAKHSISMDVGGSVATELKRSAAGSRVSYNNTNRQPRRSDGSGKFGGLAGGPSGGTMNTGGKRRSGRRP